MKKNVHVIIQARMGATRLPGKVLMPFAGSYSFLEWIVERCKQAASVSKVIVATTDTAKDDPIAALCEQKGYDHFHGSEPDVLARYYGAAKQFGSEIVVRVTSDNPLVDIPELDRLVGALIDEKLDYASNHPAGLPLGTGCEVFTMSAFERVATEAKDPYEHEHVTPYFYRHKDTFKQREVAPLALHPFAPSVRLTLDTAEDLEVLTKLASGLGLTSPEHQPATNDILDYLEAHPELVAINQAIVQKTFPKG